MTISFVFLTTVLFFISSIITTVVKLRYVSFIIKLLLDWIGLKPWSYLAPLRRYCRFLCSCVTWVDLLPWQCLRGTQRQLLYDPSPGCSALCSPCSFLDRHVERFHVLLYPIKPSSLWSSSVSVLMHVAFWCQLGVSPLVHSNDMPKAGLLKTPLLYAGYYVFGQSQPISNDCIACLFWLPLLFSWDKSFQVTLVFALISPSRSMSELYSNTLSTSHW